MWVLGCLSVFRGIVVGVLRAVAADTVGRFDPVVAQIAVAALAEGRILRVLQNAVAGAGLALEERLMVRRQQCYMVPN